MTGSRCCHYFSRGQYSLDDLRGNVMKTVEAPTETQINLTKLRITSVSNMWDMILLRNVSLCDEKTVRRHALTSKDINCLLSFSFVFIILCYFWQIILPSNIKNKDININLYGKKHEWRKVRTGLNFGLAFSMLHKRK